MTEQRKATDVLLELEKNLGTVLSVVRSQDLTIKILANRINDLTKALETIQNKPPQPTVEAVNVAPLPPSPNPSVKVHAMNQLPMEQSPSGFRRSSRPETYAGDDAYLDNPEDSKFPVQIPKSQGKKQEVVDAVVPDEAFQKDKTPAVASQPQQPPQLEKKSSQKVNAKQRVVDKNGKSIFLADVEIVDIESGEKIHKSRTNGTGIWQSPLPYGRYRVVIRKREPVTKAKVESVQEITVDGTESPLELPMLIFK